MFRDLENWKGIDLSIMHLQHFINNKQCTLKKKLKKKKKNKFFLIPEVMLVCGNLICQVDIFILKIRFQEEGASHVVEWLLKKIKYVFERMF